MAVWASSPGLDGSAERGCPLLLVPVGITAAAVFSCFALARLSEVILMTALRGRSGWQSHLNRDPVAQSGRDVLKANWLPTTFSCLSAPY